MIDKISTVRNPLTIIAIFAGIAEVSGTGILPFIDASNQQIFIYFLIGFPVLLLILFFLTLNFNNSVLYAPSDFTNEENYMKVARYNSAESRMEEIKLSSTEQIKMMSEDIKTLRTELSVYKKMSYSENRTSVKNAEMVRLEKASFLCEVSHLYRSEEFVDKLVEMGYRAEIYEDIFEDNDRTYTDNKNHAAIWLGKDVSAEIVKNVISLAIDFYKHLKYISISGDLNDAPPDEIHDQIYIGGSTETAHRYGLVEFSREDFKMLLNSDSIEEIHKVIRSKYSKNI